MKTAVNYSLGIAFFFLISCAPQINYMGSTYSPTQQVDIYFDQFDIKRQYKVIGVMKNEADELEIDDPEAVKKAMIKKAKEVGADGILFIGFYTEKVNPRPDGTISDNVKKVYEAKLIKYLVNDQ